MKVFILTSIIILSGKSWKVAFAMDEVGDNDYIYINNIHISGNQLTKRKIIIREIMFSEGDSLMSRELFVLMEKSRQNLLNLSLFNYVRYSIDSVYPGKKIVDIAYAVEERWYIWPIPIFEHADRNFSNFIREADLARINYGMFIDHNNFRGRNIALNLKARLGYKEQYALSIQQPNIGKNQRLKFMADFNLFRRHELAYTTTKNEPAYYKSFGRYHWNAFRSTLGLDFRPQFYNHHQFILGYHNINISDTIAMLNPNYLGNGKEFQQYLLFNYRFIKDRRNSNYYPLTGYLFELSATKEGLNLLETENYSNFTVNNTISYHNRLKGKWYYSTGIKWKHSMNMEIPYNQKAALGYGLMIHGYEYYVIDGPAYFVSKNNLKYELLPKKVTTINLIPLEKFNKIHYSIYSNLFFDLAYVHDPFQKINSNSLVNKWLYSVGLGFDLVTYYDRAFRLEYSINAEGDHGIFMHLDAAILKRGKH